MELTATQLDILNARLPAGYLLETLLPGDARHRRSELEQLDLGPKFSVPPPARALKQKESETLPARPSKLQVSEGFRKLFLVLSRLKKHPKCARFLSSEKTQAQSLTLEVIEGRLLREEYENGSQFASDVRRMFADALQELEANTEEYADTDEAQRYFESQMDGNEGILLTLRKKQKVTGAPASLNPLHSSEIDALVSKIRFLDTKYKKGIYSIVRDLEYVEDDDELLRQEIAKLEGTVARGLVQHVEACLQKSKQLPKPMVNTQSGNSLAIPPPLTQEQAPAMESRTHAGIFAPINAPINPPIRQNLTGFHDILPRILR